MPLRVALRVALIAPLDTENRLEAKKIGEHEYQNESIPLISSLVAEISENAQDVLNETSCTLSYFISFDDRRFPPLPLRNHDVSLRDVVGSVSSVDTVSVTITCAVSPAGGVGGIETVRCGASAQGQLPNILEYGRKGISVKRCPPQRGYGRGGRGYARGRRGRYPRGGILCSDNWGLASESDCTEEMDDTDDEDPFGMF